MTLSQKLEQNRRLAIDLSTASYQRDVHQEMLDMTMFDLERLVDIYGSDAILDMVGSIQVRKNHEAKQREQQFLSWNESYQCVEDEF